MRGDVTERLTDEELERLSTRTDEEPEAELVERALAELRRLRSDEWLERAAGEIQGKAEELALYGSVRTYEAGRHVGFASPVDILRKHRDRVECPAQ
jgi:hypothetical protein